MNDLFALVSQWWYWALIAAFLVIGLVVTPGRIGRIACHWGLHDTHEVPGYPGRMRIVCVRCDKRYEVST